MDELKKKYSVSRTRDMNAFSSNPSPAKEIKAVKVENLYKKAKDNYREQQGPDLEKLAFTPFNAQLL